MVFTHIQKQRVLPIPYVSLISYAPVLLAYWVPHGFNLFIIFANLIVHVFSDLLIMFTLYSVMYFQDIGTSG